MPRGGEGEGVIGNESRRESETETETEIVKVNESVNPSTIDPCHHALRAFEKAIGLVRHRHRHDEPENEPENDS
jgi:hypothetical protein